MKMIKLWIDDIREMPITFNRHCLNAVDAIALIRCQSGLIDTISFDHDLSDFKDGEELTWNTVAKYIEQALYFKEIEFPEQITFYIHSSNAAGRKNIKNTLENAKRYTDSVFIIKETPYELFYM